MKYKLQKRTPLMTFILIVALCGAWLGISVRAAGTAQISLNPSGGTYHPNDTFRVSISENSGTDAINAVEADLNYDASKLQFIGIDLTGSAFDLTGGTTGGGGSVSIGLAKSGGSLTGSHTVAAVTFKVLAGSGSTAVNFASSSAVVRTADTQNIWNGSTSGGLYNFSTPVAPPSSPPASPSSTSGGSAGTAGSTTKTSSPASTASSGNKSVPTVSGQNVNQNTASSRGQPATAQPYTAAGGSTQPVPIYGFVAIKVLSGNGKPISGAAVTLGHQTIVTDSTGVASFTRVPAGSYTVKVQPSGSKSTAQTQRITVAATNTPDVQQFKISLAAKHSALAASVWIAIVFILLAGGGIWWRRGRPGEQAPPATPAGLSPTAQPLAAGTIIEPNYNRVGSEPPAGQSAEQPPANQDRPEQSDNQ